MSAALDELIAVLAELHVREVLAARESEDAEADEPEPSCVTGERVMSS